MNQVSYDLTLSYDLQNESFKRAREAFVEDTGRSPYEFEKFLKSQFKRSLQEHLQGELGGEGITVTVENSQED